MGNKNLKEMFLACAVILLSMLAFGYVGAAEIGIIFASGALGFIMLRGNMFSVVLGIVLVFAADFAADMSFDFSGGLAVCMSSFAINFAIRARMKLLSVTVAGVLGIFAAFAVSFGLAELLDIAGMKISDARAAFLGVGEVIDAALAQGGFSSVYSTVEIAKLKNLTGMVMVPVTFISMSVFISYFSVAVTKKMIKLAGSDLCNGLIDFSHIKAEKMCAAVWAVSLIVFVVTAMSNQVIGAAAFSMLYILSAFYYVCGISVMCYLAKGKSGMGKVLWIILIAFLAVSMVLTVFIFGMIDSFVDIRKIGKERRV